MVDATRWLRSELQLEGIDPWLSEAEAEAEALMIVLDLCQGTCDCKIVYPQGEARCKHTHWLRTWNPREGSLWTFIARAVKGTRADTGTGRKGFGAVAFSYSMFFRYLYQEYNLRRGNVLGWCCPRHPKVLNEGASCQPCKEDGVSTIFDETEHKRRVRMDLLVAVPTGPYAEQEFWKCQNCANYYPYRPFLVGSEGDRCPLCKHQRGRGAARSVVWVLGSYHTTLSDQNEGREERGRRVYTSLTGRSIEADPQRHKDEESTRLAVQGIINSFLPELRKILALW